nr:synapse differentiation-inducing gene protein 1-like [Misgurnus anguillicaudatus]
MGVSQLLNSDGKKEDNQGYQVVTVQPHIIVANPQLNEPMPDHLCYSVFTMLCCCFPLGIAALVYSITTRDANQLGYQQIAKKNSRMARKLNHISLVIGLITLLVIIGFHVYNWIMVAKLENQHFAEEMNMHFTTEQMNVNVPY